MELPTLRLPRPRLSSDWLGPLGNRTTWFYVAYTVVLFVVFLVMTFPHDILIRRALSVVGSGPGGVEFSSARFAWYKGYELSGVRIGAAGDGQPAPLELSRMWVRPVLSELLRGNPYALQIEAELYGGEAAADVSVIGGKVSGALALQGIDVARHRALTALLEEGQLAGRLSGKMDFEGRGFSMDSMTSAGELALEDAGITDAKVDGYALPNLSFRQSRLKFALRGGKLEIQEFNAAGDVSAQGTGQVVLRTPLQDSALNLRATLQPTATTPDAVKALMALIPRPPGSKPDAPMTITGTLARPRVR